MVETDDAVIDEAVHEGETTGPLDLFGLLEKHHDDPGISRDRLRAYANALAARRDFAFDADGFLSDLESHRTDADTWEGLDRVYDLGDDRFSRYPPAWHDELGGSTDAEAYVRFLAEEVPSFSDDIARGAAGGQAGGIPEDTLVDVIMTVGRVEREEARAAIGEARDRGALVEDVDQHPQAAVFLAEDADEEL